MGRTCKMAKFRPRVGTLKRNTGRYSTDQPPCSRRLFQRNSCHVVEIIRASSILEKPGQVPESSSCGAWRTGRSD